MMILRLVQSPMDVPEEEIPRVEADVLERAIKDMSEWIESLPTTSAWRWSFMKARGRLENRLALLREEP